MYVFLLFLIFGICVFLAGLYMFLGHKIDMLAWRAAFKGLTIEGWKNVGKWTMVSSIFIFIIAFIILILDVVFGI